jgi:hypothetical protein
MSQSQSEDDSNTQPLSKGKGPTKKSKDRDEDVEGYNASNSDNNFEGIKFNSKKNRSGVSNRKNSDFIPIEPISGVKKTTNSSEHVFEDIEEKGQESSNNTIK